MRRPLAPDRVRRIPPGGFVRGQANFHGRIAAVHQHGVRISPGLFGDGGRGYSFHFAIWVSLLIVGAVAGVLVLGEPGPHFGAILIGGATWLGVAAWRRALRSEAAELDSRVVLIDRRRGSLVSIEPGREVSEVLLARCYTHCLEGPSGPLTCELVMECGDQEIRLPAWKDSHFEMWAAFKAYGLNGDLPLSNDELRQMQSDGSPLVRSLRDAVWRGGYRRAWAEQPVWTVWQHLLWPAFTLFAVTHALAVTLSLRVHPVPALPVEALRRLGPARCIEPPAAPVPTWPEVARAISVGMLYVVGVAPLIGAALVHTAFFMREFSLHGQEWVLLQSVTDALTWRDGLAAYGFWVAGCLLLIRMAAWTRRAFLRSCAPWIGLASTLAFTFAVWGTASMLDTLNMVADKGPPQAQFRGRVTAVAHWKVKGKAARYTANPYQTSLTISPTRGMPDMRPVSTSMEGHGNMRVGDEMCAEVYPGFFGRPWLSRLRECFRP